jgi:2,4-dienoyl-CoA reductase-like NADH-dependent reductase (Old Yellow Enzyme family)/thioredoxin reductase
METLIHLFEPITIRGLTIGNRVVMPPMGTNLAGRGGTVSEALLAYIGRRAKARPGLVIVEIASVHETGSLIDTQLAIYDDRFIEGLSRLADTIHEAGSKAAVQLHHGGRECFFQLKDGRALGPSAVPSIVYGMAPREMSREDMRMIRDAFAEAARRARRAGFDMVEIHAAHGYLLCQFLSPIANRRTDEYGSTMENRARFVVEVIRAVREEVGEGFPVSLRLSIDECIKGGYTEDDMLGVIPLFTGAGADLIHASLGTYGSPAGVTSAPVEFPCAFNAPRARRVKDVVDVPVIAVGRFTDPRLADGIIARGDADMVAFGRQFLADPDFLPKAVKGAYEDIRTCLACNQGCIERLMFEGLSVRCSINPETGRELVYPRERSGPARTVWVAGAGPAGLTAAYEALRLGHRVTVFEKEPVSGGQIRYACVPPFKDVYGSWIGWLEKKVLGLGGTIVTGSRLDPRALAEGMPDFVVIATGGRKIVPDIDGIGLPHVHDAWEVLSGGVEPGGDVLIIGGGLIGMETADFLAGKVRSLTIVEALKHSSVSKLTSHGYMLHRRLRDAGCTIIYGAEVRRIAEAGVLVAVEGLERLVSPVDRVVVAVGLAPCQELADACAGLGIPHAVVGDARQPRRIIEATEEGAQAVWDIR